MAGSQGKLQKLEALRGIAATYVMVGHARVFAQPAWTLLFSFGQEAVMLFFILSGFVIYYATFARRTELVTRTYLVHRVRRIYPLFLLALLYSYASLCVISGKLISVPVGNLFGNIFMLQDNDFLKPGVWVSTFGQNTALWSLSYEWWFYLMFLAFCKLFARWKDHQKYIAFAVSLGSICIYRLIPNQASLILAYFFLWWTGVELAREYIQTHAITWRRQAPSLIMLLILCVAWLTGVAAALYHHEKLWFGRDPILPLRHMGSALTLLLCGIAWYKWRFKGFGWTIGLFTVFAPMSYAIYIFHLPTLNMAEHLLPNLPTYLRFIIAVPFILGISYVLEERMQPKINKWFDVFLAKPRGTAVPDVALGAVANNK